MSREFETEMETDDDVPSETTKTVRSGDQTKRLLQHSKTSISTCHVVANDNLKTESTAGNCDSKDNDAKNSTSCDTQSPESEMSNSDSNKNNEETPSIAKAETSRKKEGGKTRLCTGHERALPIQQSVLELDVKEEGNKYNWFNP